MVGSHFCGIPENSDFNTNTKITNTLNIQLPEKDDFLSN